MRHDTHDTLETSTARGAYERDGYFLQTRPVATGDLLGAAVAGLDVVAAGGSDTGSPAGGFAYTVGGDPNQLVKIEQPQLASRALQEIIASPALGACAAELTGARWVQVWWVQGLVKPSDTAGRSPKVGWHQDKQYWQGWTDDSELFTAWLALSDVTADAGPMRFVPGSHRWGLLNQGDFYGQSLEDLKSGLSLPQGATWRETPAVLSAGGASFHHQLTFHGSGPNVSGRPRKSLAIHLRTDRSKPKSETEWVAKYLNDPAVCPVIYR